MTETTSDLKASVSTVAQLPGSAAQRFADRVAARFKSGEEWSEVSYADAGAAIEEIGLGLIELGIGAGDRVAILSDTRLDWTLASYAISAAGAVVVPVYPTNSPASVNGARQLGHPGSVLRGRRTAGQAAAGSRRAPGADRDHRFRA